MTWLSLTFRPDGPWQAIEVNIGTPPKPFRLYPGGQFWSHLYSPEVCTDSRLGDICYANRAGAYSPAGSSTSGFGILSPGASPEESDYTQGGLGIKGAFPNSTIDIMNIRNNMIIPNVSIALHLSAAGALPDGTLYPLEVGASSLGAAAALNALVAPNSQTSSNSWGLHIGSITPKVLPSFLFGGFDQNRVIGNVSSQKGNPALIISSSPTGGRTIDLLDIEINSRDGTSPFSFTSQVGFLSNGNSSIGSKLAVAINPIAPYLNLPKSTCDAIAAQLPVTYKAKYGLYFWNTQDSQYSKIVRSSSGLSFVFRLSESNAKNFTINIPWILLILTLTEPIITPVTLPNPVAIGTIDATIVPSTNDWAASWKGIWNTAPGTTPTISGSTNGTGSSSSDGFPTPNSSNTTKDEGLSTSAKVGIAVGAVAVAAIGCAALFFLIRRHGAQKATPLKEEETRSPPPVPERGPSPEELDAPQGNAEMEADHYGRFAIKYNENSPVEML
ncbi:hypothetical protein BGZ60DRAFT_559920 [Tricladium varicosporioides]|nr:hypothetical protein BGZ60DRAFT_559920 [Hymenoscyphus varicosporioides]